MRPATRPWWPPTASRSTVRYLKPGDRVSATTVIESISAEKATALGIGYFIDTRTTFRDQAGAAVGSMRFRVLKFKPHQQPAPVQAGRGAIQADAPASAPRATTTRGGGKRSRVASC